MRGWVSHELNCGLWRRLLRGAVILATSIGILAPFGVVADLSGGSQTTTTPIKHVIVVIGENRSLDHVYGTYRPRNGNSILNFLSEGIVAQDGSPGPRFVQARQFWTSPQTSYFISLAAKQKLPYKTLPVPTLGGAPNKAGITSPPFSPWALAAWRFVFFMLQRGSLEPFLEPEDFVLLTTGATGAAGIIGPDPRIANGAALTNGPFRLTGPDLPYDSYTGDTEHEFFQMWQQSDCSMANASKHNPTGCLHDLYPFVATTYAGPTADEGGGTSMSFYDMGHGDAPLLKKLADQYTINDNFHQPAQGGTGIQHVFLGTGDDLFWSDGKGNPSTPPTAQIANPNLTRGTNNEYIVDGLYGNCSDQNPSPGVAPIVDYLKSLPYAVRTNCDPGHYYILNNINPGFLPNGKVDTKGIISGASLPPSSVPTIGDALNEKKISWT